VLDIYCDRNKYRISGSLYGTGIACINALSEWLKVTVWKDDKLYTQNYARGIKTTEVKITSSQDERNRRGKSIAFLPDLEIFTEGIELDFHVLAKRLQELAYLNAGSLIVLKDFRLASNKEETYNYPNGIQAYLAESDRNKEHLHPKIIYILEESDRLKVEIALQWCKNDSSHSSHRILSYVNSFQTPEGGTHIEGLQDAIVQTINSFLTPGDRTIKWEKIQVGLNGIISVKVLDPIFTWTGNKLENSEVYETVNKLVSQALREYLNLNPQVLEGLGARD
jgi:DNA gyrase subunit B